MRSGQAAAASRGAAGGVLRGVAVVATALGLAGAGATAGGASTTARAAGAAAPQLAFTPAEYDFGTMLIGQTASQAFTLANSGDAATGPLTVKLQGGNNIGWYFQITSDTCTGTSLAPGQTCTVTVRFMSPAIGAGFPDAAILTATVANSALAEASIFGTSVAPAIYWADSGTGAAGTGSIWTAGLDGSNPQAIVTGLDDPTGVAVTTSHLYWTVSGDGTIGEAYLDGRNPHTVITERSMAGPAGVAAGTSHLYWTDTPFGEVNQAGLDGSNPSAIAVVQNAPAGVAADASHLYWADSGDRDGEGTINQAGLDGSNPKAIITGLNQPNGVAVGSGHIYWSDQVDGAVWKASLASPSSGGQAIATGQNKPTGVAVTSSQLYWADAGNGTINVANLDGTNPHAIVTGQQGPQLIAVLSAPPAQACPPRPAHSHGHPRRCRPGKPDHPIR